VLDLNEVLASMDKMLRRIVGKTSSSTPCPRLGLGEARGRPQRAGAGDHEPGVNARDAMPTGGKLTLETANVVLDEAYVAAHIGARVGPHVMLAVADNGVGMDKTTQAQAFEPFFTQGSAARAPARAGDGAGHRAAARRQRLGLQRAGQGLDLQALPPAGRRPPPDAVASPATASAAGGTETVLVVDDDAPVRAATCEILRRLGYQVIEARDTPTPCVWPRQPGEIHLLLTDVVMPQMSGRAGLRD